MTSEPDGDKGRGAGEPYNEAMPFVDAELAAPPTLAQMRPDAASASDALERARLRAVLLTVGVSVGASFLCWDKAWSDGRTAAFFALVNLFVLLLHCARFRDRDMARLLWGFGLTLGVVELVADALCVHFTGTLDYSVARSPMLWLSPWWMPLAWMAVSVQVGYLGARAMEQGGLWRGAIAAALLGALNIPFYEEAAYHAHWWRYQNCARIGHTPYYIVIAELFIGLALAPLALSALRGGTWARAVRAGLLGGLSTVAGGLIGFGVVEIVIGGRWSVLTNAAIAIFGGGER